MATQDSPRTKGPYVYLVYDEDDTVLDVLTNAWAAADRYPEARIDVWRDGLVFRTTGRDLRALATSGRFRPIDKIFNPVAIAILGGDSSL